MTTLLFRAGVVALIACGGPSAEKPLTDHPEPLSVAEHLDEARRHDGEADRSTGQVDPESADFRGYRCYDDPVEGVSTSGGSPLRVQKPCWTSVTSPTAYQTAVARQHRSEAGAHRARAAALLGAEKRACAGLGADAISHSPFYHREDLVRVEPVRDSGDQINGARVLFAAVPGLTAEWMERAARCHQARAAVMGYSPTFMSYCPLVAGESRVRISKTEEGLWVRIESDDSKTAAAIWGRAIALVTP